MTVIMSLIKIVECEKYAEDFLSGKLFMNPLSHFRKVEEDDENLRGDSDEGMSAIFQPNKIVVKIGDFTIPESDLSGPVKINVDDTGTVNTFCMYSLNNRGFDTVSHETLSLLKRQMIIPESCYRFGNICCVVTNVAEFQKRVIEALKNKKLNGSMGLVNYYDEDSIDGPFDESQIPFNKNNRFEEQREFRIVVTTNRVAKPYTLYVGDLTDICVKTTPEEFNRQFSISLPE